MNVTTSVITLIGWSGVPTLVDTCNTGVIPLVTVAVSCAAVLLQELTSILGALRC